MGEEARLGQNPAQAPKLARILIHLPADLALSPVELLLQHPDLAVLLNELPKARRAHQFELSLALQQALRLDLEALDDASGRAQRPRMALSAPSPLRSCLTPQALELDPDRAPTVLELEVLGDVLDRYLPVTPHASDFGELLSNADQAFLRVSGGEALLELAERTLHQRLRLLRRVHAQ